MSSARSSSSTATLPLANPSSATRRAISLFSSDMTALLVRGPGMPGPYIHGPADSSSVVDAGSRLGIEEVKVLRRNHEVDLTALAGARLAIDARDERRALLLCARLDHLDSLGPDGLLDDFAPHRRRVDREMEEDLGAHVLADVDGGRESAVVRDLTGDAAILEVLGPDPDDDLLALEALERRSLANDLVVDPQAVRSDADTHVAVRALEL